MITWIKYFLGTSYRRFKQRQALLRRFPTLRLGNRVEVNGPMEHLVIGEAVIIQSNVYIDLGGLAWCNHQGALEIGAGTCISPGTVIFAGGAGGVKIGRNFDCGPGVKIFASRSDYENRGRHIFAPVEIGDDVILYANVVISPGVTIGDRACIAAGAVVTKDIPADCLAGGQPATIIKKLVQR
ncbi:MAG: acyltransferase [Bacteroidota bacterium]